MFEHPRPRQQSGASFLGWPRRPPAPPPPRPEPPVPPNVQLEGPPWCREHTWRSDNQVCPQCQVVRHYWWLNARGN
eukprot:9208172-Heterocapsa_arctica.AAC.1